MTLWPTSRMPSPFTARPEPVWSQYDYADVLLEHKGEAGREKAMPLLDE